MEFLEHCKYKTLLLKVMRAARHICRDKIKVNVSQHISDAFTDIHPDTSVDKVVFDLDLLSQQTLSRTSGF